MFAVVISLRTSTISMCTNANFKHFIIQDYLLAEELPSHPHEAFWSIRFSLPESSLGTLDAAGDESSHPTAQVSASEGSPSSGTGSCSPPPLTPALSTAGSCLHHCPPRLLLALSPSMRLGLTFIMGKLPNFPTEFVDNSAPGQCEHFHIEN